MTNPRRKPEGVSAAPPSEDDYISLFRSGRFISLDEPADDPYNPGLSRAEVLPEEDLLDPEQAASHFELIRAVRRALQVLSPRQERVIRAYFGIGHPAQEDRSPSKIAHDLGITGARVWQVKGEALRQLRGIGLPFLAPYLVTVPVPVVPDTSRLLGFRLPSPSPFRFSPSQEGAGGVRSYPYGGHEVDRPIEKISFPPPLRKLLMEATQQPWWQDLSAEERQILSLRHYFKDPLAPDALFPEVPEVGPDIGVLKLEPWRKGLYYINFRVIGLFLRCHPDKACALYKQALLRVHELSGGTAFAGNPKVFQKIPSLREEVTRRLTALAAEAARVEIPGMAELMDRMRADLARYRYAPSTQQNYLNVIEAYGRHYNRSPAELGEKELRQYLQWLTQRKMDPSTLSSHRGALKFFYRVTLNRPSVVIAVFGPPSPRYPPPLRRSLIEGTQQPWWGKLSADERLVLSLRHNFSDPLTPEAPVTNIYHTWHSCSYFREISLLLNCSPEEAEARHEQALLSVLELGGEEVFKDNPQVLERIQLGRAAATKRQPSSAHEETLHVMGGLWDRLKADLRKLNLDGKTKSAYLRHVKAYALYYDGRSPEELGEQDVRNYLLHLAREIGLLPPAINSYRAALKFLYEVTLGKPQVVASLSGPRQRFQA